MKACRNLRWSREDHCLCVQWVGEFLTLISTVDRKNDSWKSIEE